MDTKLVQKYGPNLNDISNSDNYFAVCRILSSILETLKLDCLLKNQINLDVEILSFYILDMYWTNMNITNSNAYYAIAVCTLAMTDRSVSCETNETIDTIVAAYGTSIGIVSFYYYTSIMKKIILILQLDNRITRPFKWL